MNKWRRGCDRRSLLGIASRENLFLRGVLFVKKIFLVLVLLFSMVVTVSASELIDSLANKKPESQPKIAILVHVDPTNVNKPIDAATGIYTALEEDLTAHYVTVLPYEETRKVLRSYIRENDLGDSVREGDLGFIPKKKDMEVLCKDLDVDYILFVSSRVTSQEVKRNFWTGQRKHSTILFDVALYEDKTGEYLIDELYTDTGKTQGSFERAYKRATKNILEQIDLSTIQFTK